ncbi:protein NONRESPONDING TO OXYLIPINS 2, mitochondrial isoform X2 [Mercurialis annua]|uniref:protein NONRESPONDING TO OXYLIPINS 2, mitochondrial isoform X2 n=1 Tax=Mercurialis annua TaxID=3986 RepID=UPI00215F7C8B|nr:protein NONRESPONDING TO OXYLIPINS 2, mitochondrial isoform X2 [Mercurialis annua]
MATSRTLSRLSTHLPSLSLKSKNVSNSSLQNISPLKSSYFSQIKPNHPFSRLPVELSCLVSMLPLHSTIASARLTSLLPIESQTWGLVPQGKSMPL